METLKVYQGSPNTLVKMKKGPGRPKKSEAIIKDVKRRTKRLFNPEEKIAIVLEGLSGDESIAAICRREGIAQSLLLLKRFKKAIDEYIKYYNNERYQESLNNCTPASVYKGTNKIILEQRRLLKQKSMKQRRRNHLKSKSASFFVIYSKQ